MFTVGNHLVEDLSWFFGFKSSGEPIVEKDEYQQAVERLTKAGYSFKTDDAGWKKFSDLRSKYASVINQMANLLAITPAQWIGDRSYLPHRQSRSLRRRLPSPRRGAIN